MNYVSIIKDSIETSVSMKIFKNKKESLLAHVFRSKLKKIPLSKFMNVENFNPERLKKSAVKAYPLDNRPRGDADIKSVKYYQKIIQNDNIPPIWMIKKNNKYILLDGAHRIVASYIEDKKYIYAFLIS